MDECNLQTLVNLTGGNSETIPGILKLMAPFGRNFVTGAEPVWTRATEPGLCEMAGRGAARSASSRARDALKVLKTLGLYLRENGKLVKIDDPRFDPMWEAAGALGMPVLIHTSRPGGFLHAHRPVQRALRRAAEPSGLVVLRQGFSAQARTAGGAQPGDRPASEDHVHRTARGESAGRSGAGGPVAGSVQKSECGDRRAHRRIGTPAAHGAPISSIATRTGFCFGTDATPMPARSSRSRT